MTLRALLLAALSLALAAPGARGQLDALNAILNAQGGEGSPFGQPAEPEKPKGTPLGEGDNIGFVIDENQRLELHARDLLVVDAMGQLRQLVRRNIVVDPEVEVTFTGDLYDVDVMGAIDAICRSTNLVFSDQGSYIFVEPAAIEMKVYELMHSRSEDLIELIKPLLTQPEGSVSGTEPSKQGIKSTQEEAGGDDFASHDVIVVRDYPSVIEIVDEIVAMVDAMPTQVLIEATILTAELQDGFEAGVDLLAMTGQQFNDVNGESSTGNDIDIGPIDGGTLDEGLGKAGTALAQGISNEGLNLALVKNGVAAFVRAIETTTNTTVLANPKILTVNKQRGEVLLGRRDGYLTTIVSETSTTQKVEFLETGTRLVFRPFVLDEGYVRLEIHPEDSDGGINEDGLPFSETAEVTSNIMVRDGQTVAIGGLFRERNQTVHEQVPILGDIPLLGWLFQSSREALIREEIIVLVTPRIIDFSKDPSALAGGLGLPFERQLAAGLEPWELPAGVDPYDLAATYLAAGHALLADGRPGEATLMADVADYLGTNPEGVLELRAEAWAGWLPDTSSAVIDDRILRMVVESTSDELEGTE
jgi:hypothetical protein